MQILSRRKKNNPILIGEAGVGKSAIVEGLALRMAADEVPATIRGKRLYSLDVSSLVAGTKYRGEFEERMQRLLEELRRKQDSILFIDEIHTIAGAGSTQGSPTRPTFSNLPGAGRIAGHRSHDAGRNIEKISRAIPRWNAAFRKSSSNPLRKRKPCKSCATSHPIMNGTTECATRTKHCGPASP